jgi:hypothetical protein
MIVMHSELGASSAQWTALPVAADSQQATREAWGSRKTGLRLASITQWTLDLPRPQSLPCPLSHGVATVPDTNTMGTYWMGDRA